MERKFCCTLFLLTGVAASLAQGCYSGCCGSGCCAYSAVDCQDVMSLGFKSSGVYNVTPPGLYYSFEVYCDLDTDDDGGWTVIQRRTDGSLDFEKNWDDYESGFGDSRDGEHWLGLLKIHSIVLGGYYELRVDLQDWDDIKYVAKYKIFKIGDSNDLYRLTIAGYNDTSNAGESMIAKSDTYAFATKDKDTAGSCATTCRGGWWYSTSGDCHDSNLNGIYASGGSATSCTGIIWNAVKGQEYSMKTAEMKIRRI